MITLKLQLRDAQSHRKVLDSWWNVGSRKSCALFLTCQMKDDLCGLIHSLCYNQDNSSLALLHWDAATVFLSAIFSFLFELSKFTVSGNRYFQMMIAMEMSLYIANKCSLNDYFELTFVFCVLVWLILLIISFSFFMLVAI